LKKFLIVKKLALFGLFCFFFAKTLIFPFHSYGGDTYTQKQRMDRASSFSTLYLKQTVRSTEDPVKMATLCVNTPVSTYSPDGATFDAAIAELL